MYTRFQKLFGKIAKFTFELICVQEKTVKHTKPTKLIGRHVSISDFIFSNFVQELISFCNTIHHHLAPSFIGALEMFFSQSNAKMKNLFLDIETTKKIKLGSILEKLTQSHNRQEQVWRFGMNQDDCEIEIVPTLSFCRSKKKSVNWTRETFEQFYNIIPVLGFFSAEYDPNSNKSSLLPIFNNERDVEPTVIKNESQFHWFKCGELRNLIKRKFMVEQQVLIHSWRRTKLQEQKGSSHTNGFITPTNCGIQNFLPSLTSFTVNFVIVTLFKSNRQILLKFWKLDWPKNKPFSNWNYQNQTLQGSRVIKTWTKPENRNKWAHSKTFCVGITMKMFYALWGPCKKNSPLLKQLPSYVKAWFYFTKPGPQLSTKTYWCKILFIQFER